MIFLGIILSVALFLYFFFSSKNDDSKRKDTLMLNLGVALILLSSIIFATSTWDIVDNFYKILILFIETLLFLGFGILLKVKFKIYETGNALTFISTILLGCTVICAGYFELFGHYFSLMSEGKYLFLTVTFLIEACAIIIRNITIKSSKYFLSLLLIFISLFFLAMFVFNNFALASAITLVAVLIINILKTKIFDDVTAFNILNIIVTCVLSGLFIYSCFEYVLVAESYTRTFIMFNLLLIYINFCISLKGVLKIIAIVLECMLMLFFIMFCGTPVINTLVITIISLLIYITYYLSKNQALRIVSIIFHYFTFLCAFIASTYTENLILMMALCIIEIILIGIGTLKEKGAIRIFNIIVQPIVVYFLGIFAVVEFFPNYNFELIYIMIPNICLAIGYIVCSLLKSNLKYGYIVSLMIGLFFQVMIQTNMHYESTIFDTFIKSLPLVANIVLLVYSYISKDKFINGTKIPLSILFVLMTCIVFENLVSSIVLILYLVSMIILNRDNRKKYLYAALIYFPVGLLLSTYVPISYEGVKNVLFCIFFVIFTRGFIKDKYIILKYILEFTVYGITLLSLSNPKISILLLIAIYIIGVIVGRKDKKILNTYLIYLLFFTSIAYTMIGQVDHYPIYLIINIVILFINQLLYRIFNDIRPLWQEILFSVFGFIMIITLAGALPFNIYICSLVSLILILLLALFCENKKAIYISLMFTLYPAILLLNNIDNIYFRSASITMLFIIPIVVYCRKVLNFNNEISTIIETVFISLLYIPFIYKININIALVIGIASILMLLFGLIFTYTSLLYLGYVTLGITVVIQTFGLWGKIPWWMYLLIVGVVLVVVAAIRESKKE